MKEEVVVRSYQYEPKKIIGIWMLIVAGIAVVLTLILYWAVYLPDYNYWYDRHNSWKICWECDNAMTAAKCAKEGADGDFVWFTLLIPLGVGLVVSFILYQVITSIQIVVTSKRVYGRTNWKNSIDLPMDSISSVGSAWFNGIFVATSSGKISFRFVKNAKEIHRTIRRLLIERQENKAKAKEKESQAGVQTSNADELKKYKELFDCGVITQEEFEQKKKQLLGL